MKRVLSPRHRAVLSALALATVPDASASEDDRTALVEALERRIGLLPRARRRDLLGGLDLLDTLPLRWLLGRSSSGWGDWAPDRQRAAWDRLARVPIPAARALYQAVRRLVMATWYSTDTARRTIGMLPPLSQRLPHFPWEGALADPGNDTIARGSRTVTPAAGVAAHRSDRSISQGGDLRGSFRFRADAIVIGSGAGGAIAAARLAAAGREVLILEAGSWFEPDERTDDEATMVPLLLADAGMRATEDLAVQILQGATVGGGTSVNWMVMLRTPDHVLEEWRRRFGLSELTSTALAPEFARIEAELSAQTIPDAAHSPSNHLLLAGAQRLGWRAGALRLNVRGCQRAGTCTLGCRYDARQGAAQVYLPMAFTGGARLLANTRAESIRITGRDTGSGRPPMKEVRAVTCDPHTGHVVGEVVAEAPVIVVAAGAIETPVLLQRSGLGGGPVGQWLRLHPTTAVLGLYDQETYPMTGIPLSAICDEFAQRGPHGYGYWIECPAFGASLAAAAIAGHGAAHRERMDLIRRTAPFIALTRDGADLDQSNGSVSVARDGTPRIRYRLGSADADNVRASMVAAARIHLANGAQQVTTLHAQPVDVRREADLAALSRAPVGPNQVGLFSAHVNGTCRMGTNPREAAVTPEGERFGARGVFVTDGSLLPTAPGVNPQETIYALASRVAAAIIAR